MNNLDKDYEFETFELGEDAITKLKIREMEYHYNYGKFSSLSHGLHLTDRHIQCLNVYYKSNQKARQATFCFIWASLTQGVLPREIVFEIAKLIWDSRTSPHIWKVFY